MSTVRPRLPDQKWTLLPKNVRRMRKRVRAVEMTEVVEDVDTYLARPREKA